jgi:ankyrin repeat protein
MRTLLLACLLAGPPLSAAPPSSEQLFQAVQTGDAAQVKRLLDDGADPNARNASGATPLMWAVPDLPIVKLLVGAGAYVNARSTNLQRTPLLVAAGYPGSVPVLQFLLDHGADIHAKDRAGVHALGRAAAFADVDVVRFLVEHGCDPNEPGYGATVRYARHYQPTVEYLLAKGAKPEKDALPQAALWQDPGLLAKWMDLGADVNARVGSYKRTALMTAAASEQTSAATLKLLLERGADANAEDTDGERPLDWAIYRHDRGKIAVLEEFGATRGHGPRQKNYPSPEATALPDPRTAVARAVNLLLPTGPVVYRQRACISCHSQALVGMAAAEARTKGVPIDEAMEQTNLQQITTAYQFAAEQAMQGDQPAGNIITIGYVMMALAAEHHPFDNIPAAMMHLTAALQLPDGSWTPNGVSRPPMEDSLVSATALGVRALTLYPVPSQKTQIEEKLQRSRNWLLAVNAQTAEDRAMRLMGLVWAKAPSPSISTAVRALVNKQQPDGGWRQREELETDAYATGLSLYALHVAGLSPGEEPYRKGVQFLLRNQYPDGSWLVKTRSYPTQPYFESGYPFGNNQWISAAGAGWAALAIAQALPAGGEQTAQSAR